jgi:hypothetical protein
MHLVGARARRKKLVDRPVSVRNDYGPAAVVRLVSRWSPDGKRIAYLVSTQEVWRAATASACTPVSPSRPMTGNAWSDCVGTSDDRPWHRSD